MKKIITLLIILLLPTFVKADPDLSQYEYKEYYQKTISTGYNRYLTNSVMYVSDSYVYEDGLYKLINPEYNCPLFTSYISIEHKDYVFACLNGDKTECESLFVIFASGSPTASGSILNFLISDGTIFDESIINMRYADDYEIMENGHYRLKNPIEASRFIGDSKNGKYICKKIHEYEDCEDIGKILETFDGLKFTVDWFSDRIQVGDSIVFKDNKYYLQNTYSVNFTRGRVLLPFGQEMYTCFTNEDNCEEPSRIVRINGGEGNMGIGWAVPTKVYYAKLTSIKEDNMSILIDETKDIDNIKEDDTITIENKDILDLEIKDGKGIVKGKKIGETDITITSKDDNVRVIHVQVLSVSKNPDTKTIIIIPILLFIISSVVYFISKTKYLIRKKSI